MKLVKKTKNLYFFECNSKKELDTLVTKQVTSDIRDKSHTTLLLTPSHELEKIYKSIICDYKHRLVGFKSACAYITEEFLDLDHPIINLSTRKWMNTHLFDHINIKNKHIHYPTDYGNVEYSQYDRQIWRIGGIDLTLLVMRDDGNLTSDDFLNNSNNLTHAVKLEQNEIDAFAKCYKAPKNKVPKFMVSVGMRSLLNTKRIVIYATGSKCAKGILALSKGVINNKYPCTALINHRDVRIFMDKSASKLLKKDNQ